MHKSTTGGRHAPRRRNSLSQQVRTARRRKPSSTRWLQRQLNDPFVAQAQAEGYRSRAAYKLAEIADRFQLLQAGDHVLDLGCAPGGWCQVAVRRGAGRVVGVDLQSVEPIRGVQLLQGDFSQPPVRAQMIAALDGLADCVLSDLAAPATGHRATDRLRVATLAEDAAAVAMTVLKPDGAFVAKVLRAGVPDQLRKSLTKHFRSVRHFKPRASRSDSDEIYVVALAYRGSEEQNA